VAKPSSLKVTKISNQSASLKNRLLELLEYRQLLWIMIQRDLKVRYKQTIIGIAWAVLQPITMMVIFSVVFGRLAKIPSGDLPYPVFVFAGLLAWNFFSSSLSSAGVSLVGAGSLISKVYFPRLIIPMSSIGVVVVDFLIGAALLILLMLLFGIAPSSSLLLVPFCLLGLITLSLGLGAWLAAITVSYRDFRFVIPFMLQLWMFVSTVIYPASFVPEKWRWLLWLNPVNGWISGIRSGFLNQSIDFIGITISTIFSLAFLFIGLQHFGKAQRRFADVI